MPAFVSLAAKILIFAAEFFVFRSWKNYQLFLFVSLTLVSLLTTSVVQGLPASADENRKSISFECPARAYQLPKDLSIVTRRVAIVQSGGYLGSGVVVSASGLLLTAAHVLHGQKQAVIYLPSREAMTGTVLRLYPKQDIALLRLPISKLPCLPIASQLPPMKSRVFLLGFQPMNEISGVISEARVEGMTSVAGEGRYLRTSLKLFSGHSGGPILNDKGEVVGIISARMNKRHQTSSEKETYSLGASTLFLKESERPRGISQRP